MDRIKILPPEIISKIAAGEVIERPASVVKELVENSLDAGAQSVYVGLKGAGKNLIRVTDDGGGIAREDIETLFSRHATSKISAVEDLYAIHSLGFRGEALYSVAAVADVMLSARAAGQDCGWEIHVRGGEKLGLKPRTMKGGCEIEVKELFFNTPARKKFLKSNAAELNAVMDIFLPYCLLYPEKSFTLESEEKRLIDLKAADGNGGLAARASETFGLPRTDLIEGKQSWGELSIRLLLGDINIRRQRKDLQFVYINSRPVSNRTISFHMNEIYRLLFPAGTYPFFCVFVEMPAAELDVNVHPSKREVKFRDDLKLVGLLRSFAENLLMTRSKTRQMPLAGQEARPAAPVALAEPSKEYAPAPEAELELFKAGIAEEKSEGLKEKLRQARYLGNLLKRYLIFETPDSILVVDQHAAQERITFERLRNQLQKGSVEVQPLLSPVLLRLTPQELVLWEENKETFAKAGFEATLFDKETLAVHAHPALITDAEVAVRNLLAGGALAGLAPEKIARMACRSSVMFGFAMNPEQAEFQRASLLMCDNPFTCPHGRPTVIEIKEADLRRQFLRA
jgi:DNA mismatch repair protein MutL